MKKASAGEGVIFIYRFVLVAVSLFIMFGIGAMFYRPYIDVRNSEAQILAEKVLECALPDSTFSTQTIEKIEKSKLSTFCNFTNNNRYFIELVVDSYKIKEGNEDLEWLRKFMSVHKDEFTNPGLKKSIPGYFYSEFTTPRHSVKIKILVNPNE